MEQDLQQSGEAGQDMSWMRNQNDLHSLQSMLWALKNAKISRLQQSKGIEAVRRVSIEMIEMPTNLKELGIDPTDEQIKDMAMKATNQ